MNAALALIEEGRPGEGVRALVRFLRERREALSTPGWQRFAKDAVAHPITRHIHADPFTWRAYAKPRGYAGDAVMMDYIYGIGRDPLPSPVAEIHDYTTQEGLITASIRARRALLASTIDRVAAEAGRPIEVVAVAAGHLRELDLSAAAARGHVRVTALDQDEQSLDVIARSYAALGAVPLHGSVRQLIAGRRRLPPADLVYSAGLYDYLSEPVARRLTAVLFDAVLPGGSLLLANFLPSIVEAGFMESFMDWHLIYRTDDEMRRLAAGLPAPAVASVRIFHDPHDNISFLEITRRSATL